MKKVLILAYDFPPYVSVGGLRPYSWLQYLKRYNIEPVVITRQWSNQNANKLDYISPSASQNVIKEELETGLVIKTPYKPNFANRLLLKHGENKFSLIRKLYSAFFEIMQFFINVGPKKNIYKAAHNYLKQNNVDMIIATGEPFVLFQYANKLSEKYKTPWIADYRDPWSQNEVRTRFFPFNLLLPYLEKNICFKASLITTASPFFKSQLQDLFPKKNIEIIGNGYNEEALKGIEIIDQNKEELSIAYVGTIYKWHPLESFLRTCNEFVISKNNPKIKINFYGVNMQDEIEQLIEEKFQALKKHVLVYPKIDNLDLLKYLASNNLLLLFNYYSFVGTKIFDYLALKRKILLCYKDDEEANELKARYYDYDERFSTEDNVQQKIIESTKSGRVIKNSAHLMEVLNEEYEVFLRDKRIDCQSQNTEQYSRAHQAKKLAKLVYTTTNSQ